MYYDIVITLHFIVLASSGGKNRVVATRRSTGDASRFVPEAFPPDPLKK